MAGTRRKRTRGEFESDLRPSNELEAQLRELQDCVQDAKVKLESRHETLKIQQVPLDGGQVSQEEEQEDLIGMFKARPNGIGRDSARSRADLTWTQTVPSRTKHRRDAKAHNASQLASGSGKNVLSILTQEDNLYPVYRCLIAHLEVVDIIALTRTCKALSGLYKGLVQIEWNIDKYLGTWFRNPRRIRAWADSVGAVIGGSAIFDFMNRWRRDDAILEFFLGVFEPQPKDLYMQVCPSNWQYEKIPNNAFILLDILSRLEGYEAVPWECDDRVNDSDLCRCDWKYFTSLGLVKNTKRG